MKPAGATWFAYGCWFKTGPRNLLFRWSVNQWVRSTLSVADVRSGRTPAPLVDGKKECRGKHGCGEYKPTSEFSKDSKGYFFSYCKACENKRKANSKQCERIRQAGYRRVA